MPDGPGVRRELNELMDALDWVASRQARDNGFFWDAMEPYFRRHPPILAAFGYPGLPRPSESRIPGDFAATACGSMSLVTTQPVAAMLPEKPCRAGERSSRRTRSPAIAFAPPVLFGRRSGWASQGLNTFQMWPSASITYRTPSTGETPSP